MPSPPLVEKPMRKGSEASVVYATRFVFPFPWSDGFDGVARAETCFVRRQVHGQVDDHDIQHNRAGQTLWLDREQGPLP